MNKTLLTIVAILFATFTCYAQTVTIDFTNSSAKNFIEDEPSGQIFNPITISNGIILKFTSTTLNIHDLCIATNSSNQQYLFIRNNNKIHETDVDLTISAPTNKVITSIKMSFQYINFEKFIQTNPTNPVFTSMEKVGSWSEINANEVIFHITYGTQINSIEITYEDDIPTSIGDSTQSQRPYSIIAGNGNIKVNGEWNSIRMFNSNGQLISANKDNVHCPAGTYLVQVNGDKAELVIVK